MEEWSGAIIDRMHAMGLKMPYLASFIRVNGNSETADG